MAVKRRSISEETGDYVVSSGRPVESDGVLSSVLLPLLTTRGTAAAAPGLGTRTNSIRKLTERSEREAERFDEEALQHLVDRGDIKGLSVVASVLKTNGVSHLSRDITYTDRSGERQSFRVTKKVG